MTFVGKILVIVIMVFALFFLAVSTVVYTTETNWKDAYTKQKEQVTKLQTQLGALQKDVQTAQANLEAAKKDHATQKAMLEDRIRNLQQETEAAQKDLANQRMAVEQTLQTARAAQDEAKARLEETMVLRQNLEAVQKQANEFKLRQTELNDEIRTLRRDLLVAQNNNRNLRDRVAALSERLRQHNLPTDVSTVSAARGVLPKEEVEGEVTRVDPRNTHVEISIGSDDGLSVGNELDVYRLKPEPTYIGKIRIESVDPDQAVGRVINGTRHGIKIKEGDIVSSKIGPRS
ncbi:MAG: hypothetical protein IRY99_18395 [Isosphaeraceae bacterium]|nr:hypothetical protein [Isosphaeraceae bacterium]